MTFEPCTNEMTAAEMDDPPAGRICEAPPEVKSDPRLFCYGGLLAYFNRRGTSTHTLWPCRVCLGKPGDGATTFSNFDTTQPGAPAPYRQIYDIATHFTDSESVGDVILLRGKTGRGKTHLARALHLHLATNVRKPRWVEWQTLKTDMIESRRFDEDAQLAVYAAKHANWLFIDDFGTDKEPSPVIDECLFDLIDYRTREAKPTVITTNLNPEDLEAKYGSKVWGRIYAQMIDVVCEQPDYRATQGDARRDAVDKRVRGDGG